MNLKFNNERKIFGIALLFLAIVFIVLFRINIVHAAELVDSDPFSKFDTSIISSNYEYIGYLDSDNHATLILLDYTVVALTTEKDGCVIFSKDDHYIIYKYMNNSWVLNEDNTTTEDYQRVNIDIYENNIKYASYDLHYMSDTNAFFQKTLLVKKEVPAIRGGITSKEIVESALNWTGYLIPLVLGLVVLVVAFRKGWTMLRMLLVGA